MYIHMYIMYLLWHAEPCVIHQNRKYINMNIMIYRCIYIYMSSTRRRVRTMVLCIAATAKPEIDSRVY